MTNLLLRTALAYADGGWPVFPCQPGQKTPATPHGYLDATTDHEQIKQWFSHHPNRNLAVATGAPGPDVLDIDYYGPEANGFPALTRLQTAGLTRDAAALVNTPSGGVHMYFAGSQQRPAHLHAHHVDFLSKGGYVLLPPSQVAGWPYETAVVLGGQGGLDWGAAARLLEPAREPHQSARQAIPGNQLGALAAWVAAQREGNRNAGLFWAANRALEADQAADLSPLGSAARQAGLTEPEITRTLRSAQRTARGIVKPPEHQAEGGN